MCMCGYRHGVVVVGLCVLCVTDLVDPPYLWYEISLPWSISFLQSLIVDCYTYPVPVSHLHV